MEVRYDPTVDMAYLELVPVERGDANSSFHFVGESQYDPLITIDTSRTTGKIIGIEVHTASKWLPAELLQQAT